MAPFGYDPLGLEGFVGGSYVSAHVYGWTELDVNATTQVLTVTVWGIDPYTEADVTADPAGVLARIPEVVTRFTVAPK